jgi:glutamate-1-semialdehyde 2,1-aminomutase
MEKLSPVGPVYQAGTLSGNPMAMAAGLATLKVINQTPNFYAELEKKSELLATGLKKSLANAGIPGIVNRVGSMFTLFFTSKTEVNTYADVMTCDTETFIKFFNLSLQSGIYLAPSQFEAGFVSAAHTNEDINYTIEKSFEAFKKLKK